MSRVVHFEIAAREPQQVVDFYSSVLDWKFEKSNQPEGAYWHITTGEEQRPGINGGLASGNPVGAVVNTIGVTDIDATLDKVEEHGGSIVQPRIVRPGMGWYASFQDPSGNRFGLLEPVQAEAADPDPGKSEEPAAAQPGDRPQVKSARSTTAKPARRATKATRKPATRTSRGASRSARSCSRTDRWAARW